MLMSKELKIYALLHNDISKQILSLLELTKDRYIKITHISVSHYVHQKLIEDMNIAIILGSDIQKLYEPIFRKSISMSVNPLFVFNIIELKGEKESGFQIRV